MDSEIGRKRPISIIIIIIHIILEVVDSIDGLIDFQQRDKDWINWNVAVDMVMEIITVEQEDLMEEYLTKGLVNFL